MYTQKWLEYHELSRDLPIVVKIERGTARAFYRINNPGEYHQAYLEKYFSAKTSNTRFYVFEIEIQEFGVYALGANCRETAPDA